MRRLRSIVLTSFFRLVRIRAIVLRFSFMGFETSNHGYFRDASVHQYLGYRTIASVGRRVNRGVGPLLHSLDSRSVFGFTIGTIFFHVYSGFYTRQFVSRDEQMLVGKVINQFTTLWRNHVGFFLERGFFYQVSTHGQGHVFLF